MKNKKNIALIAIVLLTAFSILTGCSVIDSRLIDEPTIYIQPTSTPMETTTDEITTPMPEDTEIPPAATPRMPNELSSDIVVLRNTMGEYYDFTQLVEKMNEVGLSFYLTDDNINGLFGSDDVILLKVNSQWNQRGGTNTDLLDSVIQAIINHPDGFTGEIIVADNGQAQYGSFRNGGSLDWEENNAMDKSQSAQDVVDRYSDKYKVSTYLWDTITTTRVDEYSQNDDTDGFVLYYKSDPVTEIKVSYPKFTTKYGTKVSFKYGIWDNTKQSYDKEKFKVINMPVLKTHGTYGVTACIKSYMGVPSDKLTKTVSHFSIDTGGMGTLMAETTVPTLNILDAIWINPIRGPRTEYYKAVNTQIVAVSTDPFALDFWAVNNVLLPEAKAAGNTNLSKIYTDDSNTPTAFGHWMRLSIVPLLEKGYIMRFSDDETNVYEVDD